MEGAVLVALEKHSLFGGSVLFGVLLYSAARFCDGFFPVHTRREVAARLLDTRARPWSHVVIGMMDRVLVGKDSPQRWQPRFSRVTFMSFATMVVIFCTLLVSSSSMRADLATYEDGSYWFLAWICLVFLAINPTVDYVSAMETRLVLSWTVRSRSVGWLALMAAIDVLATILLVVLLFPLATTVLWSLFLEDGWLLRAISYREALDVWLGQTFAGLTLSVLVYTTFATTVWTWLYVAAEGTFRILPFVRKLGLVKEKPFRSMGAPIAVIGAACWFVIGHFSRALEST